MAISGIPDTQMMMNMAFRGGLLTGAFCTALIVGALAFWAHDRKCPDPCRGSAIIEMQHKLNQRK